MSTLSNFPSQYFLENFSIKINLLNTKGFEVDSTYGYNSHVCTWYKLAKGMAVKSAILHTIPEGHGYHFGPDKKILAYRE
jgi:hypothetical protein